MRGLRWSPRPATGYCLQCALVRDVHRVCLVPSHSCRHCVSRAIPVMTRFIMLRRNFLVGFVPDALFATPAFSLDYNCLDGFLTQPTCPLPYSAVFALLQLYDATAAASPWLNSVGWMNGDPCVDRWFGVWCDDSNTTVWYVSLQEPSHEAPILHSDFSSSLQSVTYRRLRASTACALFGA